MKLTSELLAQSDSALNPLKERELDLRGLKIVVIENLGVTRDQNDALDFTDNEIKYLGNFPRLLRLQHLVLSNNLVSRIDPLLGKALPYLHTLILTNNAIADMRQLVPLRRLRRLEYLSLMGNPVSHEKHYREFVIWRVPSVRVLDFKRVTDKERAYARRLMETPDGRPSELAVQLSGAEAPAPAPAHASHFEPGAPVAGAAGRALTAKERAAIQEAIDQSESLEEIRRLEERLKMGYLPGGDGGAAPAP
ncbi:U2 snRNP complex subunit [Malassezia obtusa]|uniref:U2 small nuclear ribonucleoprotein A' n=1 Tax=Malassezia obtusa TaxID=76774 RepID=A0AAF0IVI4_9BASI|nr:U2 snRNP complex subunit [Malassezia obtusa]